MGMGFAPTWLRQASPPPLLHMTILITESESHSGDPFKNRRKIVYKDRQTDGRTL